MSYTRVLNRGGRSVYSLRIACDRDLIDTGLLTVEKFRREVVLTVRVALRNGVQEPER